MDVALRFRVYRLVLVFCLLPFPEPVSLLGETARTVQFRALSTANGLPSNVIEALHEGKSGFIWIGTPQGLVRYDGLQFKQYVNERCYFSPRALILR